MQTSCGHPVHCKRRERTTTATAQINILLPRLLSPLLPAVAPAPPSAELRHQPQNRHMYDEKAGGDDRRGERDVDKRFEDEGGDEPERDGGRYVERHVGCREGGDGRGEAAEVNELYDGGELASDRERAYGRLALTAAARLASTFPCSIPVPLPSLKPTRTTPVPFRPKSRIAESGDDDGPAGRVADGGAGSGSGGERRGRGVGGEGSGDGLRRRKRAGEEARRSKADDFRVDTVSSTSLNTKREGAERTARLGGAFHSSEPASDSTSTSTSSHLTPDEASLSLLRRASMKARGRRFPALLVPGSHFATAVPTASSCSPRNR